jgi:hypothetical protein
MSRDITMVGVAGAVAVGLTAAKALLPNPTDHWAPSQIETARPKNRQTLSIWSGWRDLNPRPLRPEARQALAMTACRTPNLQELSASAYSSVRESSVRLSLR